MSVSGQNRTRVPVRRAGIFLTFSSVDEGEAAAWPDMARASLDEGQTPGGAVEVDLDDQFRRQCVDHRCAHPVQPARGSVGAGAKLAAGVQLGKHDLNGSAAVGLLAGGDAPPVVGHLDRAIPMQGDLDQVGVSGGGLVDRVVDQLPHQVVQAG